MPKRRKKRYKHAVIKNKKYYFYKIVWADILGDAGHNTPEEFDKMKPATMITQAYVYKKLKIFLLTFSSYDADDEVFSDRNAFPIGCIIKMEKNKPMIYILFGIYIIYAMFHYMFIGQFNKHKPTMTKEEWDRKL